VSTVQGFLVPADIAKEPFRRWHMKNLDQGLNIFLVDLPYKGDLRW